MLTMNMGFIIIWGAWGARGGHRLTRHSSNLAIQDVCPDAKPEGLDDVHLALMGSLQVERRPLASRGPERSPR